MPSTEETNPINPNPASQAAQGTRTRPDGLPRTDKNFKKLIRDNKPKDEEDEDVALDEDFEAPSPPSLFDLSAKSKARSKSANSSLNQSPFFADAEKSPVERSFLKQPPPLIVHDDDETGMATSDVTHPYGTDKLAKLPKKQGLGKNEILPENLPVDEEGLALADKPITAKDLRTKGLVKNEKISGENLPVDEEGLALADKPITAKDLRTKGLEEEPLRSTPTVKEASEKPVSDNFLHGEIVREEAIKGKKGRPDVISLDTDATVLGSKKEKSKLNTRAQSTFTQENADLSTINPHLQHQSPIAFLADKAENMNEPRLTRSTVKDIIEQIVANMQTVQTEGKTDTIITLRYPPILEGATVTLTAFEGTKREFNLSFANLTDDAKRFLDRKITEDSLVESLARHDIIINTLTTKTTLETHADNEAYKYLTREEREQQRERQSQQEADDEQA
ncbi:Conserved hypothetical protein [Candidatus Protochlamydia naegleriophila]|uniref:Uncharacterized protein n=1 Tax=Candidatus Protochlamydia naegleriophila TaxID=389348 RepID=A0A0U5JB10_9BACT|nr:hypothetical protein [Candidatus Protochlamydia naegleriophila]CUI15972.1 Conserved hypothetical protein [Candidatus Protochlamydia naegleriophila]